MKLRMYEDEETGSLGYIDPDDTIPTQYYVFEIDIPGDIAVLVMQGFDMYDYAVEVAERLREEQGIPTAREAHLKLIGGPGHGA